MCLVGSCLPCCVAAKKEREKDKVNFHLKIEVARVRRIVAAASAAMVVVVED
jgi:hypothetical protein